MNRHPPQTPSGRLDAEERALAALLPRPHGRTEPAPDLDARILAAARAATQPRPTRRPRRSWIAPTAVVASLMLAVGLAWQLRPPPAPQAQAVDAAAPAASEIVARAFEAPPASPEMQDAPMPMVEARPAPATTPMAEDATPRMPAPTATADAAKVAAAPMAAPPPAPPAPPPAAVTQDAAAMPQVMEPARAPAPAMAKARTSEAARERITVSGTAATRADHDEAERAANAAMLDTVAIDDPGDEVPPATADSPQVRDAWLKRIGELLKQGKTDEAKASLAEFKRRYPDASLPPELRKLEP